MQHRANPQARGRHRRTDPQPRHRAPRRPTAPAERAATTAPAHEPTLPVAAAGPATAEALPRHRAPRQPIAPVLLGERGRHAVMTAALVAGVGATGLAGATAAAHPGSAAGAQPAVHAPTAPSTPPADPAPLTASTPPAAAGTPAPSGSPAPTTGATARAGALAMTAETPGRRSSGASRAAVRAERKAKPTPPPAPTAQWVHPMPESRVTSCYGPRWGRLHAGVDLAAPHGTPIRAVGAGIVVRAGMADGYGLAVLIDHGNGFLTHYGHLSVLAVTEGQRVKAGEQIGDEGSTGHSTGPHLHLEVHQGSYKNPIEPTAWLAARGVDLGGCAS